MTKSGKEPDFDHVLELTQLVAAYIRKNNISAQRHRENLTKRGETDVRLRELDHWRESLLFTPREKAAIGLSESISLNHPKKVLEKALEEARRHFNIAEIVSLTLADMAINDWFDLHSEPRVRVLVVEDNLLDQELLRRQLRKSNIEENVIFVPDAREALVLLEGYQNGLFDWELITIFLDIHLPGMNGIDLLRRIRTMQAIKDLPVTMMTGSTDPRDIEECRRLQVANYIQKPINFKSFSQVVANLFHPSGSSNGLLRATIE